MNKPIKCFLIDDDDDDQEIFNLAVAEVDPTIECYGVNNCVDALEKLNSKVRFVPHYIFIDINMPKLNGIDCLKGIKKIDSLQHVPVYMYSTSADPQVVYESLSLGANDFIVKPTDISELARILKNIFTSDTSSSYGNNVTF